MLFALVPPLIVADLGAGEGTLSQLLAKRAKKVIAVDNSEKMVEFGAELAKKHGFKNLEYPPRRHRGSADRRKQRRSRVLSQALHHAIQPGARQWRPRIAS